MRLGFTLLVALVLGVAASPARAAGHAGPVHEPAWRACPDAVGYQCADVTVPRDYGDRRAGSFRLALARLPARNREHRIGSLFVNFGGPGGPNVATLKANGTSLFGSLRDRFDIVTFDPRGTGESQPAIDCAVDQEAAGVFRQPFATPLDVDAGALVRSTRGYVSRCLGRNTGVLPYVATANVARDLDVLRQAVGDTRLSYLGFSYGTFLGATYASMFPRSYRALVLDGALDADEYANRPRSLRAELSAAVERAVGRFLQACAADQPACSGFGGADPWAALDALIERVDAAPLDVGDRTLDGDDVRVALAGGVHSKRRWPALGLALARAQSGDGAMLRELADGFYGRTDGGSYRPILDQFLAVSALDQRNSRRVEPYLRAADAAWSAFDHGYWLSGYPEYAWGAYPVHPRGVYRGPFRAAKSAPAVLVVGTTYDPATPYKGAVRLVRELGHARLLTMDGDGHGAYGGDSPCIDGAVDAYLEHETLPAAGTRCRQQVPFDPPASSRSAAKGQGRGTW